MAETTNRPRTSDMSAALKKHRAVRIAVPRLSLPAILFFAVAGFGGSLFLTYTNSFPSAADGIQSAASPIKDIRAYPARAVPFGLTPEPVAARAVAVANTASESHPEPGPRAETAEFSDDSTSAAPVLFAEEHRALRGFNRFSNFGSVNSYMALSETGFGMSAQGIAPSYIGPDNNPITAPVPEPSTWLCAAALLGLVMARALHAAWHRNQRRVSKKSPRSA